jgi:plastocyanin
MAVAILALTTFGGCSAGAPTAAPSAGPTQGMAAIECNASGSGTATTIADFAFMPSSATVASGGTITWTNQDGTAHTVTFNSGPDCLTIPGSGGSQTIKFNVAGTYPYHCDFHRTMTGSVTVS